MGHRRLISAQDGTAKVTNLVAVPYSTKARQVRQRAIERSAAERQRAPRICVAFQSFPSAGPRLRRSPASPADRKLARLVQTRAPVVTPYFQYGDNLIRMEGME